MNINHSRCCDQAICTECFVQIKRIEPTTTHLVSEPAACPYCVQDNFGVVYTPPAWRSGIGSDAAVSYLTLLILPDSHVSAPCFALLLHRHLPGLTLPRLLSRLPRRLPPTNDVREALAPIV